MITTAFRVGITGAAGTGKSSLAKCLSEKIGIGLIEAKSITKEILIRDCYDYCSGIQIERFLASPDRQKEILDKTINTLTVGSPWVTDRTLIDLAAYAVNELHDIDTALLRKIFFACKKHASIYTHIFLCPWMDVPLENNKKRTLNPWYQFQIHALEKGIMEDWGIKYHILKTSDTASRIEEIIDVIGLKTKS